MASCAHVLLNCGLILCPSFHAIHLVDQADAIPTGYHGRPI
jgi:hypothetical protein